MSDGKNWITRFREPAGQMELRYAHALRDLFVYLIDLGKSNGSKAVVRELKDMQTDLEITFSELRS